MARNRWLVLAGLLVLTIVPLIGAAARLGQITRLLDLTRDNARFAASPAVAVVHITCANTFIVLGALQFAPRLLRAGWHRAAGRWLVAASVAGAVSGLWMTAFYPRIPGDGALLDGIRFVAGSAWLGCALLGTAAIRRSDVRAHRAWMTRAYAVAMGAGTQAVAFITWQASIGEPGELARALLHGGSWAFNLALAEWIVRRAPSAATELSRTGAGTPPRTCSDSFTKRIQIRILARIERVRRALGGVQQRAIRRPPAAPPARCRRRPLRCAAPRRRRRRPRHRKSA
jgi:uncharacterized membrane protein